MISFLEPRFVSITGQSFPGFTDDERKQGEILFPGQSITYEMSVPFKYLPYVQFRVEGNVSQRYLFHCQITHVMPEEYTKPVVIVALKAFNNIEIHEILDSCLNCMPVFNSDTRLVDTQEFYNILTKNLRDIKKTQNALNAVYKEYKLFWIQAHVKLTFNYLEHVKLNLGNMIEALNSKDLIQICEVSGALTKLKSESIDLNLATEKLIEKNSLSDEDVEYKYRIR
jgi:hypothetical protein